MSRGLDHIVHAVRDLDAGAELYRRAGFTVGARNRHPWGTHNHLVQLPGFFVEVLTVAEPDLIARDTEHRELARLFGAYHRDAIQRGEGFSFLALESESIAADVSALAGVGIGCSGELRFSRQGTLADGRKATLGFSLGFASDAASPHAAFAVAQQHNPQAFWNTEFQTHDNTARSVLGVVLIADNPTDHHIFLSAYTGERELHSTSAGILAHTPRGDLEIIEPVAFRDRYGVTAAAEDEGMTFAALRLGVARPAAAEACLKQGGIAFHHRLNGLVVGPDAALGATLVFEAV